MNAYLSLVTSATVTSSLDSDASNGLQLTVKRCPAAWSVLGGVSSCSTGATELYSGRVKPVTTIPFTSGTDVVNAGAVAHLELKVTLPASAATVPGLAGNNSTLQFTWTATNT